MKEKSSKRNVLVTKKKTKRGKDKDAVNKDVHMSNEVDDTKKLLKKSKEGAISLERKRKRKDKKLIEECPHIDANDDDVASRGENAKHMKTKKKERKGKGSLNKSAQLQKKEKEPEPELEPEEFYNISSGDEDNSKGMRKWITQYHERRPGLQVLQQRIDEFITDHESKLEQERKEKEGLAAEGGWTVVVHHKGRKKTTDSESGIAVGSASQAAIENHLAKKKNKDVGIDFYRFQKREARRNEIVALQSKFEEDKKRIQQLRAARKFKPY